MDKRSVLSASAAAALPLLIARTFDPEDTASVRATGPQIYVGPLVPVLKPRNHARAKVGCER
jgi:hypothetical protein